MKKEQWEYISNNWGTSDPVIMEEIAKMKDADALEIQGMETAIAERDETIRQLTQQNIDLNKTNMNLVLRLTDPAIAPQVVEDEPEPETIALDDYDKFVKG